MNEKDLLQKINDDARDVTPPASLSPDAIEQMLRRKQEDAKKESPDTDFTGISPEKTADFQTNKKRKARRNFLRFGSIAAVFAVALTALWQYRQGLLTSGTKSESTYSASPEAGTEADISAENADAALAGSVENTDAASAGSVENTDAALAGSVENADAALADSVENADAALADSAESTNTISAGSAENAEAASDPFTYAQSYEEIYQALYDNFYSGYESDMVLYGADTLSRDTGDEIMAIAEDSATSASSAGSDRGSSGTGDDFSRTNLQEKDVDEADIVKTDGTYIYILRQDLSLAIVKADGADSEIMSITDLSYGNDSSVQEMYLDGDTLNIILSGEYETTLANDEDVYYTTTQVQTRVLTYDVSNRKEPVQTGNITQEGYYQDSRKNGSYLYLFTSYYPDIRETYEESTFIPLINGAEARTEDFYLPDVMQNSDYLVISSVDVSDPDRVFDSKILVSGAADFYVSAENIYIANQQYDSQLRTEITRFYYADGCISGAAAGSVKGYLNDSFSMNEYQGNLRVVTTYYESSGDTDGISSISYQAEETERNALYVLDENLHQIGAIEDLAHGETIRSARFFGDTGYFVTFRQTDPLFSVDLSDPENPRILGELKVSGFSSYLHFYGENQLLGIGYEADEETGSVSGLKLSMFDISDPANVTETARLVIPGITWCPAVEDYKSLLVDPEKNIIGFYCDNRYLVFSYGSENGFTQNLLYDFYSDALGGEADYDTMRGLYIGDDFYLAGSSFLIFFDMENAFEKEGLIQIK